LPLGQGPEPVQRPQELERPVLARQLPEPLVWGEQPLAFSLLQVLPQRLDIFLRMISRLFWQLGLQPC
jgi:hypothetical protein